MTKQLLMRPIKGLRFYCFVSLFFIWLFFINDFIVFLSLITYLLTLYSVDQLVSFSNRKMNDSLSFMERMDCLLFVHVINSC